MADLVVRATLRDNVLPQLAKIAAGMKVLEQQMQSSNKRMNEDTKRSSDRTSREVFKIDNAMRGVARRMIGRVLLIGGAIAAAAGHAVAFTAALWPMLGAMAAVPAISVGLLGGIAALITGFVGLGKAMKKTGGGSSSSADQIVSAQRRIEMANRSLRDSQEALNDAWETARDKLRDIQTQYAGSKLDVEAAALAVRDAELALRKARSSGDRQERARADLALRQAQLALIEAQNRATDVEQEYQDVMAKGVEGSDEVRDATERQADAMYELAQAQKALADAQKGGGGSNAQAQAYAKLSAAGKELVDTFHALAPAWRKVQQATQQALLTGVADDVKRLSDTYFPVMLRQLPALAGGWNTMIHSMSDVATSEGFVRDMDESLGLMAVMWERVGGSFGKFLSGFRNFTRVGADFMPRFGSWVDRMATKFDLWSARVRETGEAYRWIDNALVVGHKFNELMKSWGRSLFDLFRLGQDRTLIDNLVAGSQAFERWLKTAEGQERITRMWERVREVGSAAWLVIKQTLSILAQTDVSAFAVSLGYLASGLGLVAKNMGVLGTYLPPLITAFVALKIATVGVKVAQMAYTAVFSQWLDMVKSKEPITATQRLGAAFNALGMYLASVAIAGTTAGNVFGKSVNPQMDALVAQLDRFSRTGRTSGELARVLGDDLEGLGDSFKRANLPGWLNAWTRQVDQFTGVGDKFSWTTTHAQQRISALDEALATMVRQGNLDAAADAFERVRQVAADQGVSVEKLKELMPEYFAALQAGYPQQDALADAVGVTADEYLRAMENLQDYTDLLKSQTDPVYAFMRAQEDLAAAQERYNDAVATYGQNSPQALSAAHDLQMAFLDLNSAASDAAAVNEDTLIPQLQALEDKGLIAAGTVQAIADALHKADKRMQELDGATATLKMIMERYTPDGRTGIRLPNAPLYFHGGGVVPGQRGEEVAAVLKAGETVLPFDATRGRSGPVDVHVTWEVTGGNGGDFQHFLAYMIKKHVRVNGAKSLGLAAAS